MANRILLIVEGEADEKRFFTRLFDQCFRKKEYQIYAFRSNIHVLAQELYHHYPNFERDDIDIRLVLKSLEEDQKRKDILSLNYSDIFLIFDFDPHHDHTHFDTVRKMLKYFSDSTAQGKLYLNYPMMQSYKHFSILPDPAYATKVVSADQIKHYKKIVGDESRFTDLGQYDYKLFYSIAVHQLMKARYLIDGVFELPSIEEYLNIDCAKIYDYELELFLKENCVLVLNTCIFQLCDYAPTNFFSFIQHHRDDLFLP